MCNKLFSLLLNLCLVLIAVNEIVGNYEFLKYFQQPDVYLKIHNRKETNQRILDVSYPCEKHDIKTEDGYIISIFHIPYSPKKGNPHKVRPKVLLQHGLLSTSDAWILNGPDNSLPFMLADQGFDVWLGNSRGNLYGRKHENLSTTETLFWRFSWHEIGYYDLAAIMEYILEYDRQQEYLHFIGHSQGCTALMVLLSLRPDYQQKLKSVNLLAPAILFDNTEDNLLKILGPYLGLSNIISQSFASQEFLPFNELFSKLAYNACRKDSGLQAFCSAIAFMLEGSLQHKNESALQILLETHPGGISTDQIIHFTQVYQSSSFRQYDFGYTENFLKYQQPVPPVYPLETIYHPLHVWYGIGDRMANWKDILKLSNIIPNVELHRIPDNGWSHGDFMFSMNSRVYVNEPILKILIDSENEEVFKTRNE